MKRKPKTIKRIGLIANLDKSASRQAARLAAEHIRRECREVAAETATAEMADLDCLRIDSVSALARQSDLLLVFGGDGTILEVARKMAGAATPILGINVGRLGFLTAISFKDMNGALQKVWQSDYIIDPRALIHASGQCLCKESSCLALNDIVISHGAVSRLIELDVSVDGKELTRYRGDGLIISSPTGSTAYSLSAGGPIITPDADVLVITPVCPHTLSNRSIVVSSKATIDVKLVSERVETIVSADGEMKTGLGPGETITVRKARRSLNILQPGGTSFFQTVRHKLHWRGSYV